MAREKVEVVEVGLRDGLQILDRVMPTADKIAWLEAEHAAGVRRFEAASFVPPKLMPQMADAAEVVAAAKRLPGATVTALVPNLKGAMAAVAAGRRHPDRPGLRQRRAQPRQRAADAGRDGGRARRGSARCARRPVARSASMPASPPPSAAPSRARCREDEVVRIADGLPGGGRRHDRPRRHGRLRQPGAGPAPVRQGAGGRRRPAPLGALPRHARPGPRQRGGRARRRHPLLRRLARRPRRLPARARGQRQRRHRGSRLHAGGDGLRHRHRPRGA